MENQDVIEGTNPKLWNPNAAASWCIVFSPIFGAWLQAKNWNELNQPEKAKKSMMWVYLGVALAVLIFFLPDNVGVSPWIIFLIVWYFASGKQQAKYIAKNNIVYDKKKWGKPLLLALVIYLFYIFLVLMTAFFIFGTQDSLEEVLETESKGLVTQIVQKQLGSNATCSRVDIEKKESEGRYQAVAYMNTGKELRIIIELKGDQILVSIPPGQ